MEGRVVEENVEEVAVEESKLEYATEVRLYNKWSYEGVEIQDISLLAYSSMKNIKTQVFLPFTAGRYQKRAF